MKKLLTIILLLFVLFPISALAQVPDLKFTASEGKYIYCNNHEFIRPSELADTSNEKPKFIMNNIDMTADKYSIFVSHINHTELRDENNKIIAPGFDIEIDVLFLAKEDTVISFNAAGFEVPKNGQYWYKGKSYTYEDAWGCFNCWATYLQIPIRQLDSGTTYTPSEFSTVEITIPKGNKFWLSQILPDYSPVPFYRPMNLMSDFEIISGKCDINVAALKSTGTLGDRSNFAPNTAFGAYDRDRQYKGVADSMNEVSTTLNFEINDDTWSGISLPVKVYNQKQPQGNETTKWYTHLNPSADPWSGDICTESDMLAFKYYDPSKLNYYGKSVPDSNKDSVWYFDTTHSDTSSYDKNYTANKHEYLPNRKLQKNDSTEFACNLGNYGVKVNYNISITNNGKLTRYATYKLSTSSNNVVYVCDENGNLINDYALCKGVEETRVSDNMACVELPANKTTTFTVTVILTTNYSGGMQNEIMINDMPKLAFVYDSVKDEIIKPLDFTGKEFYKWENSNLYIETESGFVEVNLPQKIKEAISGNLSQYSLLRTDNGFVLKPVIYDGIPYYTVQDFFKTVYFMDENFNLTDTYTFRHYPKAFSNVMNINYVYAGSILYSEDNKTWKSFESGYNLPCYNFNKFAATSKDGNIYLSTDGKTFDHVNYQSFKGDYIDSIGNIYYYASKNNLYYSDNGIYWNYVRFDDNIRNISIKQAELIVNNIYSEKIRDTNNIFVKLNDEYLGFDKAPYIIDGVTYVPLRFLCESMGATLSWDKDFLNITKENNIITLKTNSKTAYVNGNEVNISFPMINNHGTAFIPLRFISENLGYTVTVNDGIIKVNN